MMLASVRSSDSWEGGVAAHSPDSEVMTFRELIDRRARTQPEACFLISPETGGVLTFRGLQEQASFLSTQLRQAGLERGGKVAFLLENGLFTAQLFLGAMYGGFVSVPLNVHAGVSQLSYTLDHCDAKVVFVAEENATLIAEVMAHVRRTIQVIPADLDGFHATGETPPQATPLAVVAPEDEALLMYTSGSTGHPKAAVHSHRTLLSAAGNVVCAHQLSSVDRSLLVLPLYHMNGGAVTLVPTLLSGGSVVVPHRFSVSEFWDWLEEHHCTWSALVPTIISQLVNWPDARAGSRGAAFQRIRFLRSSSAPLAPSLQREFLDKFSPLLIQAMGSSEAGNVFSNPLPPGENKIGSTGLPTGFEVKIVDPEGVEVPAGEPGEVVIRGLALAKGYYKEPEQTAAVFDPDGWLHTGDLAYRDEDGYFFVVGRSKELIIKGGVNIAPRQIDDVLESHPAVLEAAAVGVPDHHLGEDVVAFVVLRAGAAVSERELLAFCESRLGHFKTPTRIHFAGDLPKGPSGKMQRLRLVDEAAELATVSSASSRSEFAIAHSNDQVADHGLPAGGASIEQIIAETWREVLSQPRVDADSNFFALGGHSLLAIQCVSRLRDKIPVALSLSDFFENGTVAQQAALVRQRMHLEGWMEGQAQWEGRAGALEEALQHKEAPSVVARAIPPRDPTLPCPLSIEQRRLWFLEQLNPGLPVYNEAEAVRLLGELNTGALERALNVIVARHEVLRTTIQVSDDGPVAVVHESWPLQLKKIDLSALAPAERQAEVERLLIEEPRRLYHLESEPGVRTTLLRLAPRDHVFILMMHHIITDRSSVGIFWHEMAALYRAFCRGEALVLPPLPIQYGDYAVWQQQLDTETGPAEDLSFWTENLRGAPQLLELPADRPRPLALSYRGAKRRFRLNPTLTKALRDFSQREKTTLFTLFTAALNTLLYRYTGSEDILLGIPIANRERPELQSVIGFLIHTHVLRTKLSGDTTFRELLAHVQKEVVELYSHRAVPFDQVVRRLQPERNPSYSPLFQVAINWRDRDLQLSFIGLEGLEVEPLLAESRTSKLDLTLFVTDGGDEIRLELEYSTDLFDEARMTRMLGHYQTLLESVASDPGQRLSELPILTAEERARVLHEWNDTQSAFPSEQCIHELFEAQVRKTPEAVAVLYEEQALSYAELNRRANQLAHYLRGLGVKPDGRVAICVERSIEMIVALLGVLKAGGAYVPLDPAYPGERLRWMLEDSGATVLLTESSLGALFGDLPAFLWVLDLGAWGAAWSQEPASNLERALLGLTSRHLAYVIYTSGSTGTPKGVMVEHRGVCNLVAAQIQSFDVQSDSRVLQFASFSFDASVSEILMALCRGASLHIPRQGEVLAGESLSRAVAQSGITHATLPPAVLTALPEEVDLRTVRTLIAAGEALRESVARRWAKGRRMVNGYGPTEATVCATLYHCSVKGTGDPPIGRPIANTQIYILDEHREAVPVGVTGELYIGGAGVARGYLNRPELTAERFLEDPFAQEAGWRMYRTGDLGRWLPDGNIEFLGRNDWQVKIRGFRIELAEIESVLRTHTGVRDAVVAVRENKEEKRLVAYVVPAGKSACTTAELRDYLKQKLPDYMVPAAWVVLPALPLTPNGKVDRKALPLPGADAVAELSTVYVAPDSETEQKIAAIWQDVLGIAKVGRNDNFFDLGGHSLLLTTVHTQLRQAFNKDITMVDLFRCTTVRALAQHLAGKSDSSVLDSIQADAEVRKDARRRHRQLRRHLANELLKESSKHAPRD
jgi:amino acid adenylation domain-containing protein